MMSAINSEIRSVVGVSAAFIAPHEIPGWHPKLECGDAVEPALFLAAVGISQVLRGEAVTPDRCWGCFQAAAQLIIVGVTQTSVLSTACSTVSRSQLNAFCTGAGCITQVNIEVKRLCLTFRTKCSLRHPVICAVCLANEL